MSHPPSARQTGHVRPGLLHSGGSPVIANDQYDFYVYDATDDATMNYDHALVVPNANGKMGPKPSPI